MEERMVKIYVLIDPVTKRVRYVGKTVSPLNVRLRSHICEKKSNKYKIEWVNNLRTKNHLPKIQLIDTIPISEWKEAEIYWIKYYTELHGNMLNIMSGGQGGGCINPRKPLTEERKKQISESHKGNKYKLGIKETDETKKKRSESMKKCYAEGRREKVKYKGQTDRSVKVYDINKNLIKEYKTIKSASSDLGLDRNTICKHFKKKSGSATRGYFFQMV